MERGEDQRSIWIRASEWALWFNGLSAIYGGGYLLGGASGMPREWLDSTPFSGFVIPGLILLIIVGGTSLLAAVARLRYWKAAYSLTIVAGLILLGWLTAEFIWIPEAWAPQGVYAIAAILMTVGGYLGWRDELKRAPLT